MSCLTWSHAIFFFTYEGNHKSFISSVDGEEAYQINRKYGVTQGNTVFKISNVDAEADMIIVAKGIKVIITDADYACN